MSGIIYHGKLNRQKLESFLDDFFKDEEAFHILQEIDFYKPGEKLPQEISSKGCVFSAKGEIRWEKEGENYSTLLLTEVKVENIPSEFSQIEEEFREVDKTFYLEPLNSPQISPNFHNYPKDAKQIKTIIFYKGNIPISISPRGFE